MIVMFTLYLFGATSGGTTSGLPFATDLAILKTMDECEAQRVKVRAELDRLQIKAGLVCLREYRVGQ